MEAEQDRLTKEAVQDERARIARDLHDIIGHTFNVIVVQAGEGHPKAAVGSGAP
jgi:signal transduction histidine kinase